MNKEKNKGEASGRKKHIAKEHIREMLRNAGSSTLQGTKSIIAVAILYENPRKMALPEKNKLANMLVQQYKGSGWIPNNLLVDNRTPVAARELIYGKEIREDAGLDTAGSNERLAEMLADFVTEKEVEKASAIAFTGDSVALGQTFFAVLAK